MCKLLSSFLFLNVVKVLSIGEGEDAAKCVCVNPGRLAKGEGAGTFVELTYKGDPESMHASVISI